MSNWKFDNTYASLDQFFYSAHEPTGVPEPRIVLWNEFLARELEIDLDEPSHTSELAGNSLPTGAFPLAQAYAGHQYTRFTMLGDGRAVLLGEHVMSSGHRVDIQLKGAGKTAYSRRGDGRATLSAMLREYLISEAMHALGIPSTRSLAVVASGEMLLRETAQPGAILTRVASSHLRVGTFEYAAVYGHELQLKSLADYAIQRHYPHLVNVEDKYIAFFRAVVEKQAQLVAQWQIVGFIHGVMNTDNTTISGETIDYGPCAFMDQYDPNTVFSSIDRYGRYRYENQPGILQWNLVQLGLSLLPLMNKERSIAERAIQDALDYFEHCFNKYYWLGMAKKIGLEPARDEIPALVGDLLGWMKQQHVDYTRTFYLLNATAPPQAYPYQHDDFKTWYEKWQQCVTFNGTPANRVNATLQVVNPAVIPRNHWVERALQQATESDDFTLFHRLLDSVTKPHVENDEFMYPPNEDEKVMQTFCGT